MFLSPGQASQITVRTLYRATAIHGNRVIAASMPSMRHIEKKCSFWIRRDRSFGEKQILTRIFEVFKWNIFFPIVCEERDTQDIVTKGPVDFGLVTFHRLF